MSTTQVERGGAPATGIAPGKRTSALPKWRTRTPWPFGELTDAQRHERAKFEIAARNGRLAGPPSCFGCLSKPDSRGRLAS